MASPAQLAKTLRSAEVFATGGAAAPEAVITFCLDGVPTEKISWLSHWASVRQAYHRCREKLAALPDCQISTELLPRRADAGRFAGNPVLQHLEAHWAEQQVELTLTEFWIVHALAKFPGHVKDRDALMREASLTVDDSTITSHIKRIRRKFAALDAAL